MPTRILLLTGSEKSKAACPFFGVALLVVVAFFAWHFAPT
jgi:hypothetical protein